MGETNQAVEVIKALKELSSVWVPVVSVGLGSLSTYWITTRSKKQEMKLSNRQEVVKNTLIPLGVILEEIISTKNMEIINYSRKIGSYLGVEKRISLSNKMRKNLTNYSIQLQSFERVICENIQYISSDIQAHFDKEMSKNEDICVDFKATLQTDIRAWLLDEKSYVPIKNNIRGVYLNNDDNPDHISIDDKTYELDRAVREGRLEYDFSGTYEMLAVDYLKDIQLINQDICLRNAESYKYEIINKYQNLLIETLKMRNYLYKIIDKIDMY